MSNTRLRELLSLTMNVVLGVCAVVMTGLVLRREFAPTQTVIQGAQVGSISDWTGYVGVGHRWGAGQSPVTIVEFADFECPACRALSGQLRELVARRSRDVSVEYRHMPLPMHRFAEPAARASECAARQGQFEAMHDSLYAQQKSLGLRSWARIAVEAGVADTVAFNGCLTDPAVAARVDRDRKAFEGTGANGTPTLLVRGKRYTGVPSGRVLDSLVDAALTDARATRTASAPR